MIRVLIALLLPLTLLAADPTPETRALLDKMEVAQGGADKLEKVKTLKMVFEGTAADVGMKMIIRTLAGWDKVRIESEIPGAMNSVQAYDGKEAWSNDILFGLRTLAGQEKTALLSSTLQGARKPEQVFDILRIDGEATFEDRPCIRLVAGKTGEKEMVQFVDRETYRVIGTEMVEIAPQGEMKAKVVFHDFVLSKGGILYPKSISITSGPMSITGQVTEYSENLDLPATLFSRPTAE